MKLVGCQDSALVLRTLHCLCGALERHGELHIQTGDRLQSQWESKYFSQVMPFAIPRMCSGPDFRPDDKWRRHANAPVVTPQEFNRGIPRRIEGQIRNDATAVPIIRSVCYKWAVEHASNLVVPYMGQRDRPGSVIATEMVQSPHALYNTLWQVAITYGVGGEHARSR